MTRYLLGLILVLTLGLSACDMDGTDGADSSADPVIEQPVTPDNSPPLVPDDEPLPGNPASPTAPSN